MEKGPKFRIVGGAAPEHKEAAREEIKQALYSHYDSFTLQEKEQLKKFEF